MTVCIKHHGTPFYFKLQLKYSTGGTKNKNQGITKVNRHYPLGNMNVCIKCVKRQFVRSLDRGQNHQEMLP